MGAGSGSQSYSYHPIGWVGFDSGRESDCFARVGGVGDSIGDLLL